MNAQELAQEYVKGVFNAEWAEIARIAFVAGFEAGQGHGAREYDETMKVVEVAKSHLAIVQQYEKDLITARERGAKSMLDYIISYMNLPDCSVDNFAGFKESHMKTWREQYCK